MAKNKGSFEGQELAPMEPSRPEYAPQTVPSRRNPASAIVAFLLVAGFALSAGGAFASQAGILPPLGGTDAAVVADVNATADADVETADVETADVETAPEANGAADPTDAPDAGVDDGESADDGGGN